MAALAGYDPKEAESWRQTDQAKSLPLVKKQLTRQRRRIYAVSLLWTLAFEELLWLVYDLLLAPAYALPVATFLAAFFAASAKPNGRRRIGAMIPRRFSIFRRCGIATRSGC